MKLPRLFHGSVTLTPAEVFEHGLLPRALTGRNAWPTQFPSIPMHVYLTSHYALRYAIANQHELAHRGLIVEVDVDRLDVLNLRPDEDYIGQALAEDDMLQNVPAAERLDVVHGRACEIARDYDITAEDDEDEPLDLVSASLKAIGTCAHSGPIPPSAIRNVWEIDARTHGSDRELALARTFLFTILDSSMSMLGHHFLGDRARATMLTAIGEMSPDEGADASMFILPELTGQLRGPEGLDEVRGKVNEFFSGQRERSREAFEAIRACVTHHTPTGVSR